MQQAPLFDDLADAPAGGQACWLRTDDGIRIRIGIWAEGTKGTVLLFPGRTEYIEKYGRTARELQALGFATVTIDWRGQGLADRLCDDPDIGHIGQFLDYQRDVNALENALDDLELPRPLHLLAHSMGGCIGLRALHTGLSVETATFSGPMWGIRMPPPLRLIAPYITGLGRMLGLGQRYIPASSGPTTYVAAAPFEGNVLTHDPVMYDYMLNQSRQRPELSIGGPSMRWLDEALREIRNLARAPAPGIPCLTILGAEETIVSHRAIRDRMAHWPGGRLEFVENARHEILMETPELRAWFFARFAEHTGTPKQQAA